MYVYSYTFTFWRNEWKKYIEQQCFSVYVYQFQFVMLSSMYTNCVSHFKKDIYKLEDLNSAEERNDEEQGWINDHEHGK